MSQQFDCRATMKILAVNPIYKQLTSDHTAYNIQQM